jgi:hypothetical protein
MTSSSYEVKQANPWGKLGTSLGQGLSEQLPKEVDRFRLSQGLKKFSEDAPNLSQMQQLTRLAQIPGALEHPQLIQTFGALAQQQVRNAQFEKRQKEEEALKETPKKFPKREEGAIESSKSFSSLTKPEDLEEIQKGYITPSHDEIMREAEKRYKGNEQYFGNDPKNAINEVEQQVQSLVGINQQYQQQHKVLTDLQDNVVKRLQDYSGKLGVAVPATEYSKIEDKAIKAVLPKKQGGEGLTEQQAMKKYGDELNNISMNYESINSLGNWGITGRSAKETISNLKALQKVFKERNETENLANKIISKNKVSPILAYAIADPVSDIKALNEAIIKLPPAYGWQKEGNAKDILERIKGGNPAIEKTLKISEKLASLMGREGSPLSVAYELQKKGYDPLTWLNYLSEKRKDLNLTEKQGRELDKPRNTFGTLNDWWLSVFSGLDKVKGEK